MSLSHPHIKAAGRFPTDPGSVLEHRIQFRHLSQTPDNTLLLPEPLLYAWHSSVWPPQLFDP